MFCMRYGCLKGLGHIFHVGLASLLCCNQSSFFSFPSLMATLTKIKKKNSDTRCVENRCYLGHLCNAMYVALLHFVGEVVKRSALTFGLTMDTNENPGLIRPPYSSLFYFSSRPPLQLQWRLQPLDGPARIKRKYGLQFGLEWLFSCVQKRIFFVFSFRDSRTYSPTIYWQGGADTFTDTLKPVALAEEWCLPLISHKDRCD